MAEELRIVELAERSDTGRVRDHNEDRAFAAAHLVAVADGMGGALAGEVASQMAVEAIEAVQAPADPQTLRMAIENANRAIRRMAAQDPSKAGMGTTVTAATVEGDQLEIVHVGDSRAYLWRDGELTRLTDDHSVVAELVRRGSLSPEEAENHPHRNVITRALGAEPDVKVDTYQHALLPDDVLLLCSDGLYTEVTDEGIAEVLRGAASLEEAVEALVGRANDHGGSDNVTVVLARVGTGPAVVVNRTPVASDTQEIPTVVPGTGQRPLEPGRGEATPGRPTKVIGGHGATPPRAPGEAAATSPILLEKAPGRRRGRGPLLAAILVLVVLIAGFAIWGSNRLYHLEASGEGGTVRVMRGLTLGPVDLSSAWEDTGVAAEVAGDLGGTELGQGNAVLRAATIVWTRGLPGTLPVVTPAPTATAPSTTTSTAPPATTTGTAPAPSGTTTP